MGDGKRFCEVAAAGILYHMNTNSAYDTDAMMKKVKVKIRLLYLGMNIKKMGGRGGGL